jgi:tetratricopeptide (TPR) repeat protein
VAPDAVADDKSLTWGGTSPKSHLALFSTMSSAHQNPRRPPEILLPWAGVWAGWIAEAISVGLSPAECREAPIAEALDGLSGRSYERIIAGETAGRKATDELIRHLVTLLRTPAWSPFHREPDENCDRLLRVAFLSLERLNTLASANPNTGGVVSRALLRLYLVQSAMLLGALSASSPTTAFQFLPWKSKEGLGRVIREITRSFRPTKTDAEIIAAAKISSSSVWDRLLRGEPPTVAPFDFDSFASLLGPDAEANRCLGHSLRRAFVGHALVRRMRQSMSAMPGAAGFWNDAWREFERVHALAADEAAGSAASGQPLRRLDPIREKAAVGASGFWTHTFAAIAARDWEAHLEAVATAACVVVEMGGAPSDDNVVRYLAAYRSLPEAELWEQARLATGTSQALDLIRRLPDTFRRDMSLGREFMFQKRYPEARVCFEAAFARGAGECEALLDLAWFEARHGDAARAIQLLHGSPHADRKEYPLSEGEALYQLHRYEEALEAFQRSIERGHAIGHAHGRAALCCRQLGLRARATDHARTCERFTGHDPLRDSEKSCDSES